MAHDMGSDDIGSEGGASDATRKSRAHLLDVARCGPLARKDPAVLIRSHFLLSAEKITTAGSERLLSPSATFDQNLKPASNRIEMLEPGT